MAVTFASRKFRAHILSCWLISLIHQIDISFWINTWQNCWVMQMKLRMININKMNQIIVSQTCCDYYLIVCWISNKWVTKCFLAINLFACRAFGFCWLEFCLFDWIMVKCWRSIVIWIRRSFCVLFDNIMLQCWIFTSIVGICTTNLWAGLGISHQLEG